MGTGTVEETGESTEGRRKGGNVPLGRFADAMFAAGKALGRLLLLFRAGSGSGEKGDQNERRAKVITSGAVEDMTKGEACRES
jgi:hypothetical protein